MPTKRLFLDIRYYESDFENAVGMPLPHGPGRIFRFPKSIHAWGARIARKLREYGFIVGAFDHLYVNFTTVLPEGQCRFSPRQVCDGSQRIQYIDFGLVPSKINHLSETAKESLVIRSTFEVLRFVAGDRHEQQALVDRVATDVAEQGSELEVVHKTKESNAYAVIVTYQIRPNGKQSVGLIEYCDKQSNQRLKSEFVKLSNYEDIFALVGLISVTNGIVRLKPRPSFKASLHTAAYKVPFDIPILSLNPA